MGRRLIKALEYELAKIKSDDLRKITKKILLECSDYCCDAPTSSTGKYHPPFCNGEHGLIKHIKAVCRNVEVLLETIPLYDGEEWDYPYIASILHDLCKYTKYDQKWTNENHPNLIADLIREQKGDNESINNALERIAQNAETHMGRWNKCKHSPEKMPIPKTMEHFLVHFADMIAARKWFIANFDENNNIISEAVTEN
jgi:HD superfamily phosphodiesterase